LRKRLLSAIGQTLYSLRGWTFEPLPPEWEKKQVIIGLPHDELIDTAMAFGGFAMVGLKGHIIVKQEAFRWPLRGLLLALGAIPVARGSASGLVAQLAEQFAARETFQLAIVPSGTRKQGAKLRTGFWYIAKAAKVPVMCWFFDRKQKRTRWVGRLIPGEDLAADLQRVKQLYAAAGYVVEGIEA
jgi:1-acyl-sn-glycerol-3-phosphate acyltransferase